MACGVFTIWQTGSFRRSIQHNPNAASGREAVVKYFSEVLTVEPKPIPDKLSMPIWLESQSEMPIGRRQFLILSPVAAGFGKAQAAEPFWAEVQSGKAIILLRHAEAPGSGDPPDFKLGDCSTQRNLSEEGRAQSRAIGDLFRANGIPSAAVYSSQWCRCLDTARLLGLGEVEPLDLLNSFFGDSSAEPARSAALLDWLREQRFDGPAVFVTHQVNITGLTGEVPDQGELIVVRIHTGRPVELIGRVPAPF
ncbi:phosphohistidine phosphatase SixA [Mesorhizobium alhagi CCNWXJ12-2]|uniref:Phosphohistidine phosphatase SixA n=1 Tax=Mesorhizobium alhagi CCNWXJ12-2 TaxID=1107882 RepID=H0HPZ8_9HYPH|nr:phosphohistidine phosphatase SixA [Mesorhizobium alhagi CCNWXJ12-2]